jgi:citrate synthase
MLEGIGSKENVPKFLEEVKGRKKKLMGFGHRIYKNYDPRAAIIKKTAYEVCSPWLHRESGPLQRPT